MVFAELPPKPLSTPSDQSGQDQLHFPILPVSYQVMGSICLFVRRSETEKLLCDINPELNLKQIIYHPALEVKVELFEAIFVFSLLSLLKIINHEKSERSEKGNIGPVVNMESFSP